jgi:DNA transformation protein and related proteins
MADIKGDRLYVNLGPSQVRRRLKGHGYGVRKVESAGKSRAVIIHTATGGHCRELRTLFSDVLEPESEAEQDEPV